MGKTQEAVSKFVAAFRRKPPRLTPEEYALKMLARGIDENGNAKVSSVPLEPPVGYKKQPSMVDIVREAVRSERLAIEAEAAGYETFEESDDFEVGDDDGVQLRSIHELPDAPSPHDLKRMESLRASERRQRKAERFEYWQDRREFQRQAGQEPRRLEESEGWGGEGGAKPRPSQSPSSRESGETGSEPV